MFAVLTAAANGSTIATVTPIIAEAWVIAILVSFLKPYIELKMPPANALHDATIRLTALVLGVIGDLGHTLFTAPDISRVVAWDSMTSGFFAAMSAIVSYHVVTASPTSVFSTPLLGGRSATPPPTTLAPSAKTP